MYMTKQLLDEWVREMAKDRKTLVTDADDATISNHVPETFTGGGYCSPKQPLGEYPVTPQAATITLVKHMGYHGLCAATDFALDYTQIQRLFRGQKVRLADAEKVMLIWTRENKSD